MSYKRPDHYTKRAKQQGYAARSVFKLEEIDQRHRIFSRGDAVVDLGCAPGSWSRYARKRIADGPLVGVDLSETSGVNGHFLQASVYDIDGDTLLELLGRPADILISDMAPATTGDRFGDHVRQIELAQRARVLATEVLRPGGAVVLEHGAGQGAAVRALLARAGLLGIATRRDLAGRERVTLARR